MSGNTVFAVFSQIDPQTTHNALLITGSEITVKAILVNSLCGSETQVGSSK